MYKWTCFILGRMYLSKSRSVCIVDIVTHGTAIQHREPASASAYLLLYTDGSVFRVCDDNNNNIYQLCVSLGGYEVTLV